MQPLSRRARKAQHGKGMEAWRLRYSDLQMCEALKGCLLEHGFPRWLIANLTRWCLKGRHGIQQVNEIVAVDFHAEEMRFGFTERLVAAESHRRVVWNEDGPERRRVSCIDK